MIKKINRNKTVNKQDITKPKSVDDMIKKYDLENSKVLDYLDYLVDYLNEKGV